MPFSSVNLANDLQMNNIKTPVPLRPVKICKNLEERNSSIWFALWNKSHALWPNDFRINTIFSGNNFATISEIYGKREEKCRLMGSSHSRQTLPGEFTDYVKEEVGQGMEVGAGGGDDWKSQKASESLQCPGALCLDSPSFVSL